MPEALQENEQLFRSLVQGVTDYAIYMLDPVGQVASWNAGAERIKGYKDHEVLGAHFSQFYPADERLGGTPERNLRRALNEGRFEEEGWRVRKDGSTFFAMVVIDPLFDPSGRHIGFAKITRDITERRESQARLEAAKAQLFHAQKMEAVGQLTGGVAHDFNNLLMVVRSSLDLLRKRVDPNDAAAARLIENASQATARGAALTSRMLSFARRQDLDTKEIDPGSLVRGMAELVNHAVGISINVEIRLPLRLPTIIADPHQLETSILNLVVNARDAMPDGGTILISAEAIDLPVINSYGIEGGAYVALAIRDHGTGMDEQTLSRAMEPFFTTKGVGKGSGLGLSMVHGLAQQLGGALHLRSTPGEGTTAELLLPIAPTASKNVQEPAEQSTDRLRRVLAVDDDALVLMNVSSMLEDLGYQVHEATSGSEALRILEEQGSFDLLITDHAMPKMTGAQLIELVRSKWPELPIIVASGYAEIPGGFPQGVPRLGKPFGQDELAEAVAGALSISGPARGAHAPAI
jgi:PAS domain S-box-containing protein